MTAFVDTNVLVRHLTGDPPEHVRRATAFLARADELLLLDLVTAEIVFVPNLPRRVDADKIVRGHVVDGPVITVSGSTVVVKVIGK